MKMLLPTLSADPAEAALRQLLASAADLLAANEIPEARTLYLEARQSYARLKLHVFGGEPQQDDATSPHRSSLLQALPPPCESLGEKLQALGVALGSASWTALQAAIEAKTWDIAQLAECLLYMPTPEVWTLYVEKRSRMAAALVSGLNPTLTQYTDAVAAFLRADVDAVAIPCGDDGTTFVSAFAGATSPTADVSDRLRHLVATAYAPPLQELIETAVTYLTSDVNAWMMVKDTVSSSVVHFGDVRFHYGKKRAFEYRYANAAQVVPPPTPTSLRTSMSSSLARINVRLSSITGSRPSFTMPMAQTAKVKVLLADPCVHGVWRFVHIDRGGFSGQPIPTSLRRCLFVYFDELDMVASHCKRKGKLEFCIGWPVLACIATPTEAIWVNAVIDAVQSDANTCTVVDATTKKRYDECLPMDTHIRLAPTDPKCRIHSGQRWLNLMDDVTQAVSALVKALPSSVDLGALHRQLWSALAPPMRVADYIFSRYLRTVLHAARTTSSPGVSSAVILGSFDTTGFYSTAILSTSALDEYTLRAQAETLALIVHDITESLSPCIQTGGFAEVLRLYAQVVHEEVTAFAHALQLLLAEHALSMDAVLEGGVGLIVLLDTWRLSRTQLRPPMDRSAAAMHWTIETLDKIERVISDLVATSLHYVHSFVLHECACIYMPSIVAQEWDAIKPYFNNTRISAGLQAMGLRFTRLLLKLKASAAGLGHSRQLALDMLGSLSVHMVQSVLELYATLTPSRGRLDQFRIDGLYFVLGFFSSLRACVLDLGVAADTSWLRLSAEGLVAFLRRLALLLGPISTIELYATKTKSFKRTLPGISGAYDVLDRFVTPVLLTLKCNLSEHVSSKYPWHLHALVPDIAALRTLDLDWAGILGECSVSKWEAVTWLKKRREMIDGTYPALTPDECATKARLHTLLGEPPA
ncbi:hypothetical protein SPRG_04761 [Saprolegnia parasitica CBS 223.65]|uniref:Uncharacterized protein n=1 Tax=Saprolegnia parasitica (strain CBS 223.65) TaxID=695850 RepID=A0A067CJE9_SAPPC|nr:hypothetical protein SPRG_04761 [Saprolegnia parasitica CBS 223.65]KDO30859.1 hypothetical protein SPRG_04761 [Saprolegnia parasitica CBS 223.65]|eukprot:XP_012198554.1 hypothetical protein SPRG_04761 [Saprolegnia parasitica CBS 223.65]